MGTPDRPDRLLGRPRERLSDVRRFIHRDLLVDHQAALGQGPRVPGLPVDAALSALRGFALRPRGGGGLHGGHPGPVRVREVAAVGGIRDGAAWYAWCDTSPATDI